MLLTALACAVAAAPAAADRAFTPRFSQNVPAGDITIAANTLMTCPEAALNCSGARAGTVTGAALNNNAYAMERVDVDGDPVTASSSRATLSLPPGAQVLFAGLYYGARTTAANAALRGTVLLAPPGAGYQTLSAAVDESAGIAGAYQGFVDVTSQVTAAGAGVYTVAGVESATGVDRYAGWALVVAYRDDTEPPRNLSVFDGLQSVGAGDPPLSIPVSGFETPETGAVRTRVGVVAYEGDRGASGDRARLNGRLLSDAANPETNFFNSSISRDGITVGGRDPGYENQLGFDAIVTQADGYLANGDMSATIELLTTLEQYLPGMVSLATELSPTFLEQLPALEIVDSSDGKAGVGDELETAIEVISDDPEPVSEVELVESFDDPVAVEELPRGCDAEGKRRIECGLETLPAGGSQRLELVVRPLETGGLTRTVTVTVAGTQVATSTETTRIRKGKARVRLSKEARRPAVDAGKRIGFAIGARALGETAAVDMRVCDRLPRGLRLVKAPRGRVHGGRVCWRIDLLEPGKARTLRVTARAARSAIGDEPVNLAEAEAVNVASERARAPVLVVGPPAAEPPDVPQCRSARAARRC